MWKRLSLLLAPVALILVSVQVAAAKEENEETLGFEQLPAAVQQAVKKAYPDAAVTKCERESKKGKVVYEVKLKSGRQEIEVKLDDLGTVLKTEVEEELTAEQVPDTLRTAVRKLVKKGKLLKAERKVKGDKTEYEVDVQCGKVVLELKLDAAGKVLRIGVEDEDHEADEHGDHEDED